MSNGNCVWFDVLCCVLLCVVLFFQAEDGIRDLVRSRGLGDVYKRQRVERAAKGGDAVHGDTLFFVEIDDGDGVCPGRWLSLIHI